MIKGKSIALLSLGFVLGGIIFGGLIAWRYSMMFRDQYFIQIAGLTNTAYMIRAGRKDDLVQNAEASIQQCVEAADSLWGDNEGRLSSFWYTQRYYQTFGLDIPTALQPIFAALPPRPLTSCEIIEVADNNEPGNTEHRGAIDAAARRD